MPDNFTGPKSKHNWGASTGLIDQFSTVDAA